MYGSSKTGRFQVPPVRNGNKGNPQFLTFSLFFFVCLPPVKIVATNKIVDKMVLATSNEQNGSDRKRGEKEGKEKRSKRRREKRRGEGNEKRSEKGKKEKRKEESKLLGDG